MDILILDLTRQYAAVRTEIDEAIKTVLESGEFILGPHVKQFEAAAAAYCGVNHAIGLASGTDALLLSLRALEIGPGDAVLVPSFTFFATAGVVHNVGATPIFCDIDPKTFNLDPASARAILQASQNSGVRQPTLPAGLPSCRPTHVGRQPRTSGPRPRIRAIIPVHLYGQMADMDEIMALAAEYDLAVIEDAAQAIGAEYRSRLSRPNRLYEPNELYDPSDPSDPELDRFRIRTSRKFPEESSVVFAFTVHHSRLFNPQYLFQIFVPSSGETHYHQLPGKFFLIL